MHINKVSFYRNPHDPLEQLALKAEIVEGEIVLKGILTSPSGEVFPITNGIPDFTWPKELAREDNATRTIYENIANDYDKYAPLPFLTFRTDEWVTRKKMIDAMKLHKASKVLEIGCGTGRGSRLITERLGIEGKLYLQDISPKLLARAVRRLNNTGIPIEFSLANGSYLPFPDNCFDAAHHFGGINTFAEIGRCLSELARVVKPGGKVVVGDESMGPWLRKTHFGKIMMNSNPLLKCTVPVDQLPVIAKNVKVEWIIMDAFYFIEFTVAENEPKADYHIQIPSERGGSHWTRYYGNLEGVTDETKKLAHDARRKSGKSMHQWLDEVVKNAALQELEK